MQKSRTGSDIAIYTAAGLVAVYILFGVAGYIDMKYFDSDGFFALPEAIQETVRIAYGPVAYVLIRLGIVN